MAMGCKANHITTDSTPQIDLQRTVAGFGRSTMLSLQLAIMPSRRECLYEADEAKSTTNLWEVLWARLLIGGQANVLYH